MNKLNIRHLVAEITQDPVCVDLLMEYLIESPTAYKILLEKIVDDNYFIEKLFDTINNRVEYSDWRLIATETKR